MDKCKENSGGQLKRSARKTIPTLQTTIRHEKNPEVESLNIEDGPGWSILNSALKNPLLINYIFNLLEFDDLKQCRLVCSEWNQLSISFLNKMSVIKLGCPQKGGEVTEHSPKTFKEFSQNSDIAFRAFKLEPFPLHYAAWSVRTLVEFFKSQSETIREIIVNNIKIQSHIKLPHVFSITNYFDLSPHIDNQLTHISIINNNGSKFIVATNKLTSVKAISLDHCALEISEDCFLTPEKLELKHVALVKQGNFINGALINDFLNFENLKELTIDGTTGTIFHYQFGVTKSSSVELDLTGDVKLDSLFLKNVSLKNYNDSLWEISGKLKLRGFALDHDVLGMKLTELDFGDSTIKLDLLPESLKKLTLRENDDEFDEDWGPLHLEITCPPLFSLPNLTYLHLVINSTQSRRQNENEVDNPDNVEDSDDDEEENDFPYDPAENSLQWLNFFFNCHKLTTVKLTTQKSDFDCPSQRLHTDMIPKSTENIILTGNIRAIGEEFKLNKLVIVENDCLTFLTGTLKRLRCKHLVLDLSKSPWKFPQLEKILLKLIKFPYESVAIRSLELKMDTRAFEKSSFSNFVDENSKCYLFKNQNGKAIKEWEFEKILEI